MSRLYFYVLFVGLSIASGAFAYLPPPKLTLPQLVEESSHIFVGEVLDVYFISTSGKRISPRQASQQLSYLVAMESQSNNYGSSQHIHLTDSTTAPAPDTETTPTIETETDTEPVLTIGAGPDDETTTDIGPWLYASKPIFPVIETKIRLREPLFWREGKQEQIILLRDRLGRAGYYRPERRVKGFESVIAMYKKEIGKRFIFLTDRVAQRGRRTFFVPSYEPAREEMNRKAAVQKAIKEMQTKQQKLQQQQQRNQSPQSDVVIAD